LLEQVCKFTYNIAFYKMQRSIIIRLVLPFLTTLIFNDISYSQATNSAELDSIRTYLKQQQNCWNEGSLECFMAYYWKSDSLRFVGKEGITYGWQATFLRYKKRYPDKLSMGQLDFEILYSEAYSSQTIIIVGSWHLTRENDNLGGHFSLIWKKIKGRWVIVIDHTS